MRRKSYKSKRSKGGKKRSMRLGLGKLGFSKKATRVTYRGGVML